MAVLPTTPSVVRSDPGAAGPARRPTRGGIEVALFSCPRARCARVRTARAVARMTTIAIVGPDGAGKSAVVRRVVESLPIPARSLYMGVNLESSGTVLPTTRLALALKRARGGRPDLTGADGSADPRGHAAARPSAGRASSVSPLGRAVSAVRSAVRLTLWLAEEWYRQLVAWRISRSGAVVIFDRHFFADYFHTDVRPVPGRSLARRIHGLMLDRLYPRPDAIIVLDVPGAVLESRKGEGTVDWLEQRRREYRDLEPHVRHFAVVDADRPLEEVVGEVRGIVLDLVRADAPSSAPVADAPATGPSQPAQPAHPAAGGAPR